MLPTYIKQKGDTVYYDGEGEVIYYIPEKYFTTNNAVTIGEYIEVMGIFNYDVFEKNGKNRGLKIFKYPTMIKCKPSSITKQTMLLKGTQTETPYRLLHFTKGSELICSTRIAKDIANSEKFFGLLIRANLPENLPYDELYELLPMNAELNGFNYKVTNQLFGLPISEICRDPHNLSKPFRNTKITNMTDYKAISINKIPKYVSAYTSVTSENADEAIANAIITKANGESPLEKVVMN